MNVDRVRDLCQRAVEFSATDRSRFVMDACAEDEDLRHDVDELLSNMQRDADAGPEERLAQIDRMIEFIAHGHGIDDSTVRITMDDVSARILSQGRRTGLHLERIGPYKIRGIIGEGAQGQVLLGERVTDDVCTQVAIKLVKSGVDSTLIKARYHREAQVLNDLGDHPGIARLREVGKTDDGRPYLVLDYVEGQRLDRYCNANNLDVRSRLELFLDICATVHFANTRCVAHRDLKPGNIIVTPEGRPKVIDFGIAKVLRAGSMRLTMHYAPMTLQYASPEQVSGDPVGIASDVYSLGVILNELLTGHLPYRLPPGITANKSRFERALRDAICRGERQRPSAVVLHHDEAPATGTDPPSTDLHREHTESTDRRHWTTLSRRLRELDRIVLKALRKEPQRRYASVAEFADSIRCYLDGEVLPKDVRPAGVGYQLLSFTRRHRVAVVVGSLLVSTFVATSLFGMFYAKNKATAAELNFVKTQHTLVTSAEDVSGFVDGLDKIMGRLNAVPGAASAREELARLAVDHLEPYFDAIGPDAISDETSDEALIGFARALRILGRTSGTVRGSHSGDPKAAEKAFDRAISIYRRVLERDPENMEHRRLLANGLIEYGDVLRDLQPDEAMRRYDEAAQVMPESEWRAGGRSFLRTWTTALLGKGVVLVKQDRIEEAMPLFNQVLQARADAHDADPRMARSYAVALGHIAQALFEQGAYDAAEEPARKNMTLRTAALAEALANPEADVKSLSTRRRDLMTTEFFLGRILCRQEPPRLAEASLLVESCLKKARTLLDPEEFRSQRDLALAHLLKGEYLARAGNADGAATAFAQARQILEELGETHGFAAVRDMIAEVESSAEGTRPRQ